MRTEEFAEIVKSAMYAPPGEPLDLNGIAKVMGVNSKQVEGEKLFANARRILRDIFNRDGSLLASEQITLRGACSTWRGFLNY